MSMSSVQFQRPRDVAKENHWDLKGLTLRGLPSLVPALCPFALPPKLNDDADEQTGKGKIASGSPCTATKMEGCPKSLPQKYLAVSPSGVSLLGGLIAE